MSDFYYLHVSPWSEKARWAMDLSHFSYNKIDFTPMLTTPLVRFKSRNLLNRVTVPMLINGDKVLHDSYTIAQYANKHPHPKTIELFPDKLKTQIDEWEALSDQILQAGRALVCIRMKSHRGAKLMSLPSAIPHTFRPLMLPVATLGLHYLKHKYGFDWSKSADYIETMRQGLRKVRQQLAENGDYLLGAFSYADIAVAVTLQMVAPVDNRYIPLDSDTQSCWQTPELKAEFADLIAWRNRIYDQHRLV